MIEDSQDYAKSSLTIQSALIDQFKRFPDKKTRPQCILWEGLRIKTADSIPALKAGRIRGEILRSKGEIEQGFDIDIKGWLQLIDGKKVKRLRTWNESLLAPDVEYPFCSKDGLIWVWNVYKMRYPGAQVVEEKWTSNAGMWVEEESQTERIYHCSSGAASSPDFECLVFKISVLPEK